MKKLFILLLLFPVVLFGQTVTELKADTIKLNGKVKFYTLPTIGDTTGYDLIAWSRLDSSVKLIPSTLIGSSGGGGTYTAGYGLLLASDEFSVDSNLITTRLWHQKSIDSLGALIDAGGITTLNTLTGSSQTFATGTSGTDFAISSSGTTHTFNIPDASASARGLMTTGSQTIAGIKTFSSALIGTGGFQSNTSFTTSNVTFSGAGAASRATASNLLVEGSTGMGYRMLMTGTTAYTTTNGGDGYSSLIIGGMSITERASGLMPLYSQLALKPLTITNAGGDLEVAATLYIEGSSIATVSEGSYSILVRDGDVRHGGRFILDTTTGTGNRLLFADANGIVGASTITTSNVALLDVNQNFTGDITFNGQFSTQSAQVWNMKILPSDADYTIDADDHIVQLVDISVNRTLTFPAATTAGRVLVIANPELTEDWNISGSVKDMNGNTITTIGKGATRFYYANGTDWIQQ